MLAEGEDIRRTPGWMWFGRRDIIPPVTDARTLLIDRGMLTQGFLDAEELAEIHGTGLEWDKYANRFQHIQVADHAPVVELLAVDDDLNPVVMVVQLPLWPWHPRHDVGSNDVSAQTDFTGHRQHSCRSQELS